MNALDLNTLTFPLTSDGLARIAAADAVTADLTGGDLNVAYALGIAHGLRKRATVTGPRPFDYTTATPLAGVIEESALDPTVRDWLAEHNILAAADLVHLDLDALARDVGRNPLRAFVRALAHSGRYPDGEKLKDFLVRRGIFI